LTLRFTIADQLRFLHAQSPLQALSAAADRGFVIERQNAAFQDVHAQHSVEWAFRWRNSRNQENVGDAVNVPDIELHACHPTRLEVTTDRTAALDSSRALGEHAP
jgi:hypothetical protein